MKTVYTNSRCFSIPHLCPADNKARTSHRYPQFREFILNGPGIHTVCCDGCKEVFQFNVIQQPRVSISPYGGNGDPIGIS